MKTYEIYKLVSCCLIMLGGGLAGWLMGSAIGPMRLELSGELVNVAFVTIGLAATFLACNYAIERREARDRNRMYFDILKNHISPGTNGTHSDLSPSRSF